MGLWRKNNLGIRRSPLAKDCDKEAIVRQIYYIYNPRTIF